MTALGWWRMGIVFLFLIAWVCMIEAIPGHEADDYRQPYWVRNTLCMLRGFLTIPLAVIITVILSEVAWYVCGSSIVTAECHGHHVAFAVEENCGMWQSWADFTKALQN